jgi:hypothetical protein
MSSLRFKNVSGKDASWPAFMNPPAVDCARKSGDRAKPDDRELTVLVEVVGYRNGGPRAYYRHAEVNNQEAASRFQLVGE